MMVNKFDTPAFFAGSNATTESESVTADLIFFSVVFNGSNKFIHPEGDDLLIFAVGSCKS